MRASRFFLIHAPRRRWWWPFERVCSCGMDAWPCPVAGILGHLAQDTERTAALRRIFELRASDPAADTFGRVHRDWR